MAILLSDLIILRNKLHSKYKDKDKLTNEEISILFPLWIDPFTSRINRTIKFIVLLIPIVIFGISCILIWYLWNMPTTQHIIYTFPGKDLNIGIFLILYGVCSIIIAYGIWQLILSLQATKPVNQKNK